MKLDTYCNVKGEERDVTAEFDFDPENWTIDITSVFPDRGDGANLAELMSGEELGELRERLLGHVCDEMNIDNKGY